MHSPEIYCASTGRSGTAHSLFTREELPYLLDLHLFLSRGVQPAPVASLAQAAAAAGEASSDVSLYGTFPQVG
jgi:ATP-dependent RNA helicase DDX54/DBP10